MFDVRRGVVQLRTGRPRIRGDLLVRRGGRRIAPFLACSDLRSRHGVVGTLLGAFYDRLLGAERNALAQHDRKLVRPRKVLERLEAEVLEEELGGAVQERTAEPLGSTHHVDQPPVLQRLDDTGRADPADVLDLDASDRLAVRDDGEGLERRAREPRRARHVVETLQIWGKLGARQDLIPLRDLHQLE